ncbi:hypothetical protein DD630_05820 [Streptomyces sp. BSE7F]|uniref:SGNH/GDSL hydrolase family protein n=1 Tax=Streptomyces sp. BSE7-9 TaxID=2759948 RepID=UPI000D607545|nr:SGNH/GDSL hydrolase family protein [Streptomyces sp. BSE7-9]MBJ6647145.1 SGNH/GDSL hydrolase family protein [Streptomyces sp. BSE7-9]PWE06614.1 hypothetical protein DD630_05820 [Streptomyces sp. BSE7F]
MGKNKSKRTPVMLALAGLLASLIALVPSGTASAAESIPELQWPAVGVNEYAPSYFMTTGIDGGVTVPCVTDNGNLVNLKTYGASGQVVRDINAGGTVDGWPNCIRHAAVDKNGDLYGVPQGVGPSGHYGSGPLLAYSGNTLKWKYDNAGCSTPAVGADGNIYIIGGEPSLIGLTPDIAPPTTQPKKVLDVPISGHGLCGAEVFTTKDGVGYINGGRAYFYSYGGKPLGITPSGTHLERKEAVSASGRAFYEIQTGSGSTASFKLVAYNLNQNKVDWTAPESLFGYKPQLFDSFSTPDGGVLLLVERMKSAGGVPTSDGERVLIRLTAFGQKLWEEVLPKQDANGNPYNGSFINVDTTGRVVVVLRGVMKVNDPDYPNSRETKPVISIVVFDGVGNAVFSKTMHGNLDKASGDTTGYSYAGTLPVIGPDALYVKARECGGSYYCYGDTKLYPIKVPGLGLDYPRGAVLTMNEPQQPAASSYVAMGDSYSSGEGVEPFEGPSNQPGYNECHRSENAYSKLVSRSPTAAPYLDWGKFVACSGATTNEVINPNAENHEVAQVDALSATTKYVSITIGGNDIGFVDFGTACVLERCAVGTDAYNTALDKINNILSTRLKATYEQILAKAPNAEIYVLGYPQVAPVKTESDGYEAACDFLWPDHWSDARAARDIVTRLNSKIEETVTTVRQAAAGNTRLTYVEVNGADSPFEGHTMCPTAGDSYFHNLDQWVGHPAYALHPNAQGQAAYAEILMDALTN